MRGESRKPRVPEFGADWSSADGKERTMAIVVAAETFPALTN